MDELVKALYEAHKAAPAGCLGQERLRFIRDEFCARIDAMGLDREKTMKAVLHYLDELIGRLDSSTERIRGVLTAALEIAVTGPVVSLVLAVLTDQLSNNQIVDDTLFGLSLEVLALLLVFYLVLNIAITCWSRAKHIVKGTNLARMNIVELKDELVTVRLLHED